MVASKIKNPHASRHEDSSLSGNMPTSKTKRYTYTLMLNLNLGWQFLSLSNSSSEQTPTVFGREFQLFIVNFSI
jgi:hypothetical protein